MNMIKITYKDGKIESYDANVIEMEPAFHEDFAAVIKRIYDNDDEYDEDDDETLLEFNVNEVRSVEYT